MKPSKRLSIALILIAAGIAAFIFLDFHLAKSSMNTSFTRTFANSSIPEGYQPGNTLLYIAPADNQPLSRALAKDLFQLAGNSGYFSPVLLNRAPEGNQFPAVVVQVVGEKFFWTPFYSQSILKIQMAYSNFRAVDAIETQATVILPAQGASPAIEGSGQAEQADKSFGLISLPGYRSLIIHSAAKSVLENLEDMVKIK